MKLWLLSDTGWDEEYKIVRAATAEQARKLAGMIDSVKAEELTSDGEPGLLWEYYNSGPPSD